MKSWNVRGEHPEGRAGDMVIIEAESKEEAAALFNDLHPGWVVTEVYPA